MYAGDACSFSSLHCYYFTTIEYNMKYKTRTRDFSEKDDKALKQNQIIWQEQQEKLYFNDFYKYLENEVKRMKTRD